MRRVNVRKIQTRVGLNLSERRTAYRKRSPNHEQPTGSSPIRRRMPGIKNAARFLRLPQHRRQPLHECAVERHPHRRERLVLRRLGELSRVHRRQGVVMIPTVLRPAVVVVIPVPGGLNLGAVSHHLSMLRRHMSDGKKPSQQETASDDAAGVRHEREEPQTF